MTGCFISEGQAENIAKALMVTFGLFYMFWVGYMAGKPAGKK